MREGGEWEWSDVGSTQLAITGFDDGREPWAKECGQAKEAGKSKEMDSPSEPPGRKAALPTYLIFEQ